MLRIQFLLRTILLTGMGLLFLSSLPKTWAVCPEPTGHEGPVRKGITKRHFQKSLRSEINVSGGLLSNDIMGIAPVAGLSYGFHFHEDFALELSFDYGWLSSPIRKPIMNYTGYSVLSHHPTRLYLGSLVWHPFHGKFMFFQAAIPHFDFFIKAGVGNTDSDSSKGLTYAIAAGVKIFCTNWLSLRFELKDTLHIQQVLSDSLWTNTLMFTLGVGFWIPL